MAKRSRPTSAPLTFDLPESLVAEIDALRRDRGLKTVSEVVRLAVEEFDFTRCEFATDPFRQISVRVGSAQRGLLKGSPDRSTRVWVKCFGARSKRSR